MTKQRLRPKKTYSEQDRQQALNIYRTQGATVAAQTIGCNKSTVTRWAQQAGVETEVISRTTKATETIQAEYETRRAALRVKMLEVAETLLNRINQEHYDYRGKDANKVFFDVAPSGATKDYVTAAAILVDKMRLEEGKATDRQERVSLGAIEQSLQWWADQLDVND